MQIFVVLQRLLTARKFISIVLKIVLIGIEIALLTNILRTLRYYEIIMPQILLRIKIS